MPNDIKFYEASLRIDKDNLDEEIANFPGLFWNVSDFYLDALKNSKRREERLNRVFASLASAMRLVVLEEHGKITETQIKQEVLLHPKYRKMQAGTIQAKFILDRWSALKDAFVQKSFSLKGLVSLAVSEQYQSPHATANRKQRRRR